MGFIEEALEAIADNKIATIVQPMNDINDLQKFKRHPKGTLFVFNNVYSVHGIKCYLVCFINRITHTILVSTTRGDKVDCNFFSALSDLNDNGLFFGVYFVQIKMSTE